MFMKVLFFNYMPVTKKRVEQILSALPPTARTLSASMDGKKEHKRAQYVE